MDVMNLFSFTSFSPDLKDIIIILVVSCLCGLSFKKVLVTYLVSLSCFILFTAFDPSYDLE